jgi:putative MATE family efflux protein
LRANLHAGAAGSAAFVFAHRGALAAVGTSGPLINMLVGFFIGLGSGATVLIARYFGAQNHQKLHDAIHTFACFTLIIGIFVTAIGVLLSPLILSWMKTPADVFDGATTYLRIYFLGTLAMLIYNSGSAILRALGNSKMPLYFLMVSSVVNIILDYVFVAVFHWDVAGVAWATLIANVVSSILVIYVLLYKTNACPLELKKIRIDGTILADMMKIGVPAGLQQALYAIANVMITATVNSFGPAATTGISIANNFDGLLYQVSIAPSLAVMPYVSQNIGNRNVKRASRAVREGILITIALGATFGALSAIFSTELSSIMSDNPAVIAYSKQRMIIISSTYFICGINEVFCAALRGMDRPLIPTCATLIYMFVFRFIWVYQIFPLFGEPNLTLLYLVWPVSWVLSIATLLCFYIPRLKKLKVELG